jgi:hypothetical protein
MPGPPSDLGCCDPGVQPQRDACMPQVVRPTSQRRRTLLGTQRGLARSAPYSSVGGLLQWTARLTRNSRPSSANPKVAMWSRKAPTSSGGMGTLLVSASPRCFNSRASRKVPVSVHSRPALGSEPERSSRPIRSAEDRSSILARPTPPRAALRRSTAAVLAAQPV